MFKPFFIFVMISFSSILALDYNIELSGVNDKEIIDNIKINSSLYKLKSSPPDNLAGLHLRTKRDIAIIKKILDSYGYYNNEVDYDYNPQDNKIILQVDSGTAFTITAVKANIDLPHETNIGLIASAQNIIDIDKIILKSLQEKGFPLPEISGKSIHANRQNHSVTIDYQINPNKKGSFGKTYFKGISEATATQLRHQISWEEGQLFDPSLISQTVHNIEELHVFTMVDIEFYFDEESSETINVNINIVEAPSKNISLGLGYSTYYNIGTHIRWGDFNFRRRAEKFSIDLDINNNKQEGALSYLVPHFKKHNQNLVFEAAFDKESLKSYTADIIEFRSSIERNINDNIDVEFGAQLENITTSQTDNNDSFLLIGAVYQIKYNRYDNKIDPKSGFYFEYNLYPFLNIYNSKESFTKQTATIAYCLPLNSSKKTVLGSSLQFGNIIGSARKKIPAPLRFNEGTSHDLRGYKYKTVSPLNEAGIPQGGRSKLSANIELRQMITENISTVVFFDIGNVFEESYPTFKDKPLTSYGVGFRYHSLIGPIRFDLARPLNRRNIDNHYQIYVSIGNTF